MKNKIFLLFTLLITALLVGCNTPIVVPNVQTTKYVDKAVYLPVPSQYLVHCTVATKQIDKEAYINATDEAREVVWHDYAVSLITDIKNCNTRIDALKKYNDEQVKLFSNGAIPTGNVTTVTSETKPPPTIQSVIQKAATVPNLLDSATHAIGGGFISDIVKGVSEIEQQQSTPQTTISITNDKVQQ